jgi:hypothetical protein
MTRRQFLPLAFFTVAYLVLASLGAAMRGNTEFVFYIVVMLVLIAVILAVHWRVGFTPGVLWALSAWGFLHMAGGLVPVPASWPIEGDIRVLYSWWLIPNFLKYDNVIHAYGFGVTTWVCWQALRSVLEKEGERIRPSFGLLVLVGAAGMGFGALNEVIEFAATLLVPETNVGGYMNTGWDLVSNLVGVVIAATVIRLTARQ